MAERLIRESYFKKYVSSFVTSKPSYPENPAEIQYDKSERSEVVPMGLDAPACSVQYCEPLVGVPQESAYRDARRNFLCSTV